MNLNQSSGSNELVQIPQNETATEGTGEPDVKSGTRNSTGSEIHHHVHHHYTHTHTHIHHHHEPQVDVNIFRNFEDGE